MQPTVNNFYDCDWLGDPKPGLKINDFQGFAIPRPDKSSRKQAGTIKNLEHAIGVKQGSHSFLLKFF